MTDWLVELDRLGAQSDPSVLVTVGEVRGSAPRETGAKMIVTATDSWGTIGGGQLEYECIREACRLLRRNGRSVPVTRSRRFALGANCGQCCGGVVSILFEYLPASRADWLDELKTWRDRGQPVVIATNTAGSDGKWLVTAEHRDGDCPEDLAGGARDLLEREGRAAQCGEFLLEPVRQTGLEVAVFGAGHVGAATVDILSRLDCRIRWVDSRAEIFPRSLPPRVSAVCTATPQREVAAMPAGAAYLVMTHSHPLDLEICDRILRRADALYCGLIGSRSKRRRFERQLASQGVAAERIADLVCPVGAPGIEGKAPAEIAIAIAAELLQVRDARSVAAVPPVFLEAGR